MLYECAVSIAVPTGKPAINRPRENRSSMANSSATRIGGLYNATELPSTVIAACDVRLARIAAMRLGDGIRP